MSWHIRLLSVLDFFQYSKALNDQNWDSQLLKGLYNAVSGNLKALELVHGLKSALSDMRPFIQDLAKAAPSDPFKTLFTV